MSSLMLMPFFIFIMALTSFLMISTNLLMALLNLEMAVLSMLMTMAVLIFTNSTNNIISMLIILSLGACEASLGLACLIKLSRSYGNDKLSNKSMIMC